MKWKTLKICNFILAILLAVFAVGYTFAWFADYYSLDIKLYVNSAGGYFGGGSGSKDDPYKISMPQHLYNLAWLQNSGKIDDGTYFEVTNNIDMSNYIIPPIGNDNNPFNGVFDGGGCTISNLVVSTNKNHLTNFPTESGDSYYFSSYVGLFGKTGIKETTDTLYAEIKNFILNDPVVEVASENTSYSDGTSACGLAIGYVAYKASSIGVIGGTLAVNKTGYTTYNSILGAYDTDNVTSNVSGDTGYGTSADIKALAEAISSGNGVSSGSSVAIPNVSSTVGYAYPFRAANGYSSVSQPTSTDSTITYGYTVEAASSNIGYYLGQLRIYNITDIDYSTLYSTDTKTETYSVADSTFTNMTNSSIATVTYDNIFANGDYYTIGGNISVALKAEDTVSVTVKEAGTLSATVDGTAVTLSNENLIYNYTPSVACTVVLSASENNTLNVSSISITTQQADVTSSVSSEVKTYLSKCYNSSSKKYETYCIRINDNNNLNSEGTTFSRTTYVYQKMTGGVYDCDLKLPQRSIWVSPIQAGTLKFVVCNSETSDVNFTVYKWTRNKDYDATIPINNSSTYEYTNLKPDRAYYFEIEVTEDDVKNGYEYVVMGEDGPYIAYIDVGQEGADTSTKSGTIENVDFIYTGVSIGDSGSFVVSTTVEGTITTESYTESETMIVFTAATDESATIILAYSRINSGDSVTFTVTYYISNYSAPTSSDSTKATMTQATTINDTDFATYYNKIVKVDGSG